MTGNHEHEHDVNEEYCSLKKFGKGIGVLWFSTLITAIAVCAGFVFLVGRIMEWGGFHAP